MGRRTCWSARQPVIMCGMGTYNAVRVLTRGVEMKWTYEGHPLIDEYEHRVQGTMPEHANEQIKAVERELGEDPRHKWYDSRW